MKYSALHTFLCMSFFALYFHIGESLFAFSCFIHSRLWFIWSSYDNNVWNQLPFSPPSSSAFFVGCYSKEIAYFDQLFQHLNLFHVHGSLRSCRDECYCFLVVEPREQTGEINNTASYASYIHGVAFYWLTRMLMSQNQERLAKM